jgi:hypothetical protein
MSLNESLYIRMPSKVYSREKNAEEKIVYRTIKMKP